MYRWFIFLLVVSSYRVIKTVECTAQALGDPSVTLEEVTPPVFPSGALFPNEVCYQIQ